MSADLRVIPLGELVSVKGGKRLPKGTSLKAKPTSHPYIRVRDMGQRYIPTDGLEYVPDDVFPKIKRYIVHENDVIISIVGTIGLVSVIDSRFHLASLTENAAKLTGLDSTDAHYLYYYLNSSIGQAEIAQGTVGAVQPKLPLYNIEKIPVVWPERRTRLQIVNQLRAADDKIQLNRQINQTLEQMAQAIFKSWFVDFEPVKAKIAALDAGGSEEDALLAAMQAISGKDADQLARMQAEQPEQYAELRATAELFPSAMQPSELGEIPEGWKESTVGKEFDVTMGQSPPGDTYNESGEGVPFFQGRRDFGDRFPSNRVYCTSPKRMAKDGDTLLSVRAPVGDTNIALGDCCIGRGLAAIRHKSGCPHFTYYSIIHLGRELSSFDSEGTVFGSINKNNLQSIPVIAPATDVLSVFQRIVGKIDERIRANFMETISLKHLRDTLLPKLLSGELTLPDTEEPQTECQDVAHG